MDIVLIKSKGFISFTCSKLWESHLAARVADCKSVTLKQRRFESFFSHSVSFGANVVLTLNKKRVYAVDGRKRQPYGAGVMVA